MIKCKRYLLFCQDTNPDGGWSDFFGCYDTIEEAQKAADCKDEYGFPFDWQEIVDLKLTKKIFYRYWLTAGEFFRENGELIEAGYIDWHNVLDEEKYITQRQGKRNEME